MSQPVSPSMNPVDSLNARKTYERIAFLYDFLDAPYEIAWKRPLRRRVFEGLTGAILDVSGGR